MNLAATVNVVLYDRMLKATGTRFAAGTGVPQNQD